MPPDESKIKLFQRSYLGIDFSHRIGHYKLRRLVAKSLLGLRECDAKNVRITVHKPPWVQIIAMGLTKAILSPQPPNLLFCDT